MITRSRATIGHRSDDRIRDDVVDELNWDGSITNEAQIRVSVKDGIVTVAGQVDSFSERQAVTHAAERVRGVRRVVDATSVVLRYPATG
jgi:osmotically-inducible protein OsmY